MKTLQVAPATVLLLSAVCVGAGYSVARYTAKHPERPIAHAASPAMKTTGFLATVTQDRPGSENRNGGRKFQAVPGYGVLLDSQPADMANALKQVDMSLDMAEARLSALDASANAFTYENWEDVVPSVRSNVIRLGADIRSVRASLNIAITKATDAR